MTWYLKFLPFKHFKDFECVETFLTLYTVPDRVKMHIFIAKCNLDNFNLVKKHQKKKETIVQQKKKKKPNL